MYWPVVVLSVRSRTVLSHSIFTPPGPAQVLTMVGGLAPDVSGAGHFPGTLGGAATRPRPTSGRPRARQPARPVIGQLAGGGGGIAPEPELSCRDRVTE